MKDSDHNLRKSCTMYLRRLIVLVCHGSLVSEISFSAPSNGISRVRLNDQIDELIHFT